MTMVALRPDLVLYAARRILRHRIAHIHALAAMGMEAVWIEECCTDQISPKNFAAVNVPVLRECVDEIRRCGMKSIYYFCGNSMDRLDLLLSVGADGLHFEESKKGFVIELEQLVKKIQGRCTLFGNLDSIGVLQDGTEEALRSEVRRQITVGRQNGNRFVMSTGSPITPGTPVERVRLYTDLVREFGAGR
jgi:uroporphyrinogen-III decarboxylase